MADVHRCQQRLHGAAALFTQLLDELTNLCETGRVAVRLKIFGKCKLHVEIMFKCY